MLIARFAAAAVSNDFTINSIMSICVITVTELGRESAFTEKSLGEVLPISEQKLRERIACGKREGQKQKYEGPVLDVTSIGPICPRCSTARKREIMRAEKKGSRIYVGEEKNNARESAMAFCAPPALFCERADRCAPNSDSRFRREIHLGLQHHCTR